MEQSRAIDALAPFLALSKTATSPRAAADLVLQAISAPETYIFADLLRTPSVQKLQSDDQFNAHYKLLEIFAWGTYEDYSTQQSSLPSLTELQVRKLRLLSLITISAKSAPGAPESLGYATLQSRLGLDTTRAVEQLVTDAIYAELLTATLDPAHQTVRVSSVAPLRDLAPGRLASMLSELKHWEAGCDAVLADLEANMAAVRAHAAERTLKQRTRETEVEVADKQAKKDKSADTLETGVLGTAPIFDAQDADAMDIDGQDTGLAGPRRSSRR